MVNKLKKDFLRYKTVYLMALPVIAYYIIFHYRPMYGAIIAFKDFSPGKGIWGSTWVGFDHFTNFFNSFYFWRLLKNTVMINVYGLIFGFPAPIILALLLNELRNHKFKRVVQTISYMPHFLSIMVVASMIISFTGRNGVITDIMAFFGAERVNLLMKPEWFKPIYVTSGIWQGLGWGSIIYLAALSGIDTQLYEAAVVDGANRWKQIRHITIPGIMPTIIILLILNIGRMMSVGFEKIILLYNPMIYESADVISSFVYRKGLLDFDYSYSTAIGLLNSVVNLGLLIFANWLSRRTNETSLW